MQTFVAIAPMPENAGRVRFLIFFALLLRLALGNGYASSGEGWAGRFVGRLVRL